ncbi:HU family DNA-binding protein [Clostridium baratii]
MNKVSKSDLIYSLSKVVGVPQSDVKRVVDAYVSRLKHRLENGETVKFLNICYLVNNENKHYYHETLAYISTEIGNETKLGRELVFRILSSYEDMIVHDLRKFYSYGVRGLVKFRYTEYTKGVFKVRVNKGSNLDSNIRVVTLNSFKRKVEVNDWKNT